MEYRYKSTFTSIAKVAVPTEHDRFLAQASLLPLRAILPSDINPEENPDLLYFSCNGAVAGLCNKNGDAITNATALAIYKTAKNKYVSIDHDREKVVGVVLYPALSKFGTNEPISDEVAGTLNEPFNMAFAGVLWKVINPILSKYIANNGDDTGSDALSMSWEISFNSYDIGVGSRNLFDAEIIKADDPKFNAYSSLLRANGGEGCDAKGQEVFRIIGEESIILGYSVVPRPAAEVKGILPVTNEPPVAKIQDAPENTFNEIPASQRSFLEQKTESGAGYHMCNITMANGIIYKNIPILNCRYAPNNINSSEIISLSLYNEIEEKNITLANTRVNNNISQPTMKIENIDQLESFWPELVKMEASASVAVLKQAIENFSKDYVAKLEAKENLIKNAEEAKAANEKRAQELEASLAEVKEELKEVRASQEASEAQAKFSERMSAFDEEFDLDDEDRKIIASDIKTLDDEAFAAYMAKSKKLMAGKSKAAKKADKKKADDKKADDDEDKKDGGKDEDKEKADEDDAKASVKSAIASVKENDGQATITAGVTVDENLIASMAAAFSQSFKINGKSVDSKK